MWGSVPGWEVSGQGHTTSDLQPGMDLSREGSTARGTLPASRNWAEAGFGAGEKGGCLGKEVMGG